MTPNHHLFVSKGEVCGNAFGHTEEHISILIPGDAGFAALVWNLCQFQDHFKIWCKQNPNRTLVPVTGLGGAGPWWWEMTNFFFSQCERSLALIDLWLTSKLRNGWDRVLGGPIAKIQEFKFKTTLYYWYLHCAFAIKLVDNSGWVFAPTGVQFGPEWPLLSPLDYYLRHAESSLPFGDVHCWQRLGVSTRRYRRTPW
ncbi:hypothetical protein E8E11_004643 [Didymella keratinophila]|nr:hypothetical protein E8E11_004643 [Didymella keratinophila]